MFGINQWKRRIEVYVNNAMKCRSVLRQHVNNERTVFPHEVEPQYTDRSTLQHAVDVTATKSFPSSGQLFTVSYTWYVNSPEPARNNDPLSLHTPPLATLCYVQCASENTLPDMLCAASNNDSSHLSNSSSVNPTQFVKIEYSSETSTSGPLKTKLDLHWPLHLAGRVPLSQNTEWFRCRSRRDSIFLAALVVEAIEIDLRDQSLRLSMLYEG